MASLETRAPSSGEKYHHARGYSAIRDGIKHTSLIPAADLSTTRKPSWIRARLPHGERFKQVQSIVSEHSLATVCEESHCPNIGECWSNGTATLMLMGDVCTRACKFCAVDTGNPRGWLDENEPQSAANAVGLMKLRYVVLTSVDRDDLPLGGAAHYAKCIENIARLNPNTQIEALTPDFQGEREAVKTVVSSPLDVFAHNIETVNRLTPVVRDPRATYKQSLNVLEIAKQYSDVLTKSGLMLGLGETVDEMNQTMQDLLDHGVDFLTLGQYLRPTKNHLPVVEWITPEQFEQFRLDALEMGFQDVASGPLVRSSYRADELVKNSNRHSTKELA